MKRFFGRKLNEKILIEGGEFTHLNRVLRLKVGDEIIACVDDEYDYHCQIEKANKNDCLCKVLSKSPCPALPKRNIVLFQMMPKKEYFDSILAKSIELGVSKIIPFTSEYTMIKDIKKERVQTQVMTACKQCERSKLVEVTSPVAFKEMLTLLKDFDLVVFAYENSTNPFSPKILENKQNIAVIIGNEGGFSPEEAKELEKRATTISLGYRILRCDTAVCATLSLISILSGN